MLIVVLCNFSVRFGKYLFKKFAKTFNALVQNLALVVITATTATRKFIGEAAL